MRDPSTHPSLLERLTRDDAEAWREFEARYGDLLLRYGLARGLQLADAEDARQLVLLSLAKGLASFRYRPERGRFRDYLGRSVRNATFRVTARPKVAGTPLSEVELLALPDADGAPEEPDPLWEREWREHHLRRALGSLSSRRPEAVPAMAVCPEMRRSRSG